MVIFNGQWIIWQLIIWFKIVCMILYAGMLYFEINKGPAFLSMVIEDSQASHPSQNENNRYKFIQLPSHPLHSCLRSHSLQKLYIEITPVNLKRVFIKTFYCCFLPSAEFCLAILVEPNTKPNKLNLKSSDPLMGWPSQPGWTIVKILHIQN